MTIRIERMASALDTDSMIIGDVPVEVPNGVIVIFTTADPYVAGTLKVYRDQLSLQPTVDFAETDEDAGTFTMTSAPVTGEVVWCEYIKQ
jgi:hypothetical protein